MQSYKNMWSFFTQICKTIKIYINIVLDYLGLCYKNGDTFN